MAYKFQLGKAKLSGSVELTQQLKVASGGLSITGSVDLPAAAIQNVELANNTVGFNGVVVALGETGSFGTDSVTEGSTNKYYTDTRARAAVSVTDAGGDGSLSYNNSTGVISYTGPSAAEARAHFSALTGAAYQNGNIQYNSATGQITLQPVEESWVRQRLSAANAIKYNSASGSISLQLSGTSLSQNADGLKADLKTQIGAYDNSGSIVYNAADGRITFNPIAPTWVKGHFSAGAGLDYDSATGAFSVGSAEVTNAMLAGSIENAKLVNSSVTVTAGGALTGGGTVALGSSITLDVAVNGDALEVTGDAVALKSTITGDRTFSGTVTIHNLNVTGTLTTINTTELLVKDALIEVASGSVFAAGQGIRFGTENSLQTVSGFADVGNALSSSLPLVAPSMKAGTFYGSFVGASILGIVTVSTGTADISANVTRANAASQVLTLPSAPVAGQEHRIKCVVADASNPVIVIQPYAGGKIEGVVDAQITLESFGAAVSLVYGGSTEGWMVF